MKLVALLSVILFSSSLFAAGKASGGKPGRSKEESAKILPTEKVSKINDRAKAVLGMEVAIKIPRGMDKDAQDAFAARAEKHVDVLEGKQAELAKDSSKKVELGQIYRVMPEAYKARSEFTEFAEANKGTEAGNKAKEFVEGIDNIFTIVEAKLNETAENPVSTGQILSFIDVLIQANSTKLTAAEISRMEADIKAIFGGEFTLRDLIKCR